MVGTILDLSEKLTIVSFSDRSVGCANRRTRAGALNAERYFQANGFYRRPDFLELAARYGMAAERAERILDAFNQQAPQVEAMIGRSFLGDAAKQGYAANFRDRQTAIARPGL